MRLAAWLLAALLLAGCESAPVPDMTWYRLPEPVLPPARGRATSSRRFCSQNYRRS